MKQIAVIFSFLIFFQSLSVCGPEVAHNKETDVRECHASSDSEGKKASCCTVPAQSTQDEEEHDDCCGDNCHCFCCVKVVFFSMIMEGNHSSNILFPRACAAWPSFCHSFDFHPSIAYPPNV
jgi:hypothetical protein